MEHAKNLINLKKRQFAKFAAVEQLCRRCPHRNL